MRSASYWQILVVLVVSFFVRSEPRYEINHIGVKTLRPTHKLPFGCIYILGTKYKTLKLFVFVFVFKFEGQDFMVSILEQIAEQLNLEWFVTTYF